MLASAGLRALRAARDFNSVVDMGDFLQLLGAELNGSAPVTSRVTARLGEVAAAQAAYAAALPMFRAYNAGKVGCV